MKTIGIIGGLTWLSTIEYYRLLNQMVNEKRGGVESAEIILYSLNFGEIKKLTEDDHWDEITNLVSSIAVKLQQAGADCIMIGANTMHRIADDVQAAVTIPVIHIAEATANTVKEKGCSTVALLGTKYTMQLDFYKDKLAAKGIRTIIPNEEEIQFINNSIYNEMGKGDFLPATKKRYLEIIERLKGEGAEGVILGCTEIPLLITQKDADIALFDTTLIHSKAAIAFALD